MGVVRHDSKRTRRAKRWADHIEKRGWPVSPLDPWMPQLSAICGSRPVPRGARPLQMQPRRPRFRPVVD